MAAETLKTIAVKFECGAKPSLVHLEVFILGDAGLLKDSSGGSSSCALLRVSTSCTLSRDSSFLWTFPPFPSSLSLTLARVVVARVDPDFDHLGSRSLDGLSVPWGARTP